MTEELLGAIAAVILVMTRIGTVFALSPYFGAPFLPGMVRVFCAGALSVLFVISEPALRAGGGWDRVLSGLPGELTVGALLSLGLGLAFWAAQMGGALIDFQLGFGLGGMADMGDQAPTPLLGRLYYYVAVAVFLAVGGDRAFLSAAWASLRLLPPGGALLGEPTLTAMMGQAAGAFALGVQLAAPVLAAIFLTDILLGMVSRALPQLNPFFEGLPLKSALGIMVVMGSLPAVGLALRAAFTGLTASLVELMTSTPAALP
ncbi:MAG TPA: flagellar biosynthetic protein FliR [Bacillota bacterium]|nr:flagellar biosynthetic protein FliR [Bacillota bacterium]